MKCARSGQSIIESCIVIALMCLVFFGMLQISQMLAANEMLDYAADRGVRARTVGLNDFMVWKTVRVGCIPNAGKMTSPGMPASPPGYSTGQPLAAWHTYLRVMPASQQYDIEEARIPLYLGAEWRGRLDPILDYEDWDTVKIPHVVEDHGAGLVRLKLTQQYPLRMPMHRTFVNSDYIEITAEAEMENYHPLYLENTDL
jgi:hypothetical protein